MRTGEKQEKIEKIENTFSLILDTLERIENPDKGEKVLQTTLEKKAVVRPHLPRQNTPNIGVYLVIQTYIWGFFVIGAMLVQSVFEDGVLAINFRQCLRL